MLKKTSTVAAVAAGLMMLGSPAFALAGEPYEHSMGWGNQTAIGELNSYYAEGEGDEVADQFGLINFGNDSDLASNINLCQIEINVIGIPIASQNDESSCINTDNDDNDNNG
ncbi:hypothetical protein [Saccharothrix lopnurensis]|uniref:Uncharacterized protein n=1 Tax=Saccharothrix lopnurensis TaxID=1670621 RepID=A0ABW1PGR8_9PSEU